MSDSTQHTPGDWKLILDFKCADGTLVPGVVSDETGSAIAWPCGRTDDEAVANGRLLAASKKLLSAVEALQGDLVDVLSSHPASESRPFSEVMAEIRSRPSIVAANAAIRRATNQQEAA